MIVINPEKCVGCGLCAKDCVSQIIKVENSKAFVYPVPCIGCGHCVAVCPTNSIRFDDELYTEEELSEMEETKDLPAISPEDLLHMYKSRRSIRRFSDKKIEPEKLQYILDSIKYAPTGRNTQWTKVTLVRDTLPQFTKQCIDVLAGYADELPENPSDELKYVSSFYGNGWRAMKTALETEGKDTLFYHCDTVLVISAQNDIDGAIAASYVELMCHALGLGCVFVGFVKLASEREEIRRTLNIQDGDNVCCTLCIGYPTVKYHHTLPRKPRKITLL